MAERKERREAGFEADRSAFAGGGSPRGEPDAKKQGQGAGNADAENGSGETSGGRNADVQRKRRQGRQFREKNISQEKNISRQGEDKTGPGATGGKAQGGFSQEQNQFTENSREESEGDTKEFREDYHRRESFHKDRQKGRYRRRRNPGYRKGERQKGRSQDGKDRDRAERSQTDRDRKEKSGGSGGKTGTAGSFQTGDSAFTESAENKDNAPAYSKKLDKLQNKAQRAARRTERARKKLPKRREYSLERVFDEKEGRARYVLTVAEKEKPFKPDSRAKAAAGRVIREPVHYVHRKVAEVEKENSAVEGAHKAEQKMGDAYRFVKGHHKNKIRRRYKKVERLEKRQFKKEVNFQYRKFLEDNPEMSEKTLKRQIRKRLQKQRIKREYAKAKRTGQAARNTKEAVSGTASVTTAAARKIQEAAATHASVLVAAGVVILLLLLIVTSVSSCGAMFSDGVSTTLAGAYMSVPAELDAVELAFTKLEMGLQKEIGSIETDYPDYDEYRYSLDAVGHDPFVLVSCLSALHTEFTAAQVQGEVEGFFDEMYDLALTPTEETRTRTVTKTGTRTVVDPVTGAETVEEYEYEEEEEYTVSILEVRLTAASLESVVSGHMDTEQKEAYALYMETQGLVQQFYSPLSLPWHTLVSSPYGYRIHPVSGAEQLHRGVDIAVPTGTPIYAAMDGIVTIASYDSSYGNYVVIQDSGGYCTKYAHMDTLAVNAGQAVVHGEMIGTAGNTGNSTGSHLHMECLYNGEYYNPLFYVCGQ